MRERVCAGNWKMHKTAREAVDYTQRFLENASALPRDVSVVLCPPFTALQSVGALLRGNDRVALGAQDMHWQQQGAFTGEIAAEMLLEFGTSYVILGHSERRALGETDEQVRRKTAAALAAGLRPIVAVGESLSIREAGGTQTHVIAQARAALAGLERAQLDRVIVAYEPIWAIGTGHSCDPSQANRVMSAIRGCLPGLLNAPLLYGGSVSSANIAQYAAQSEIDGALVGGASLDPQSFAALAGALA